MFNYAGIWYNLGFFSHQKTHGKIQCSWRFAGVFRLPRDGLLLEEASSAHMINHNHLTNC